VKLLDDLFQIVDNETAESGFSTTIKLFPDHLIYAGHFPGHPITPGVIQLQIVHELMENHLGKSLQLIAIDDCKFLKIVNPESEDKIQISVLYATESSLLHVQASGKCETDTFFKLKGSYKII
jgi:3-hydroxyacyl-[acyl-carrier-protein] dehydratase